jgi:hypothetical protein
VSGTNCHLCVGTLKSNRHHDTLRHRSLALSSAKGMLSGVMSLGTERPFRLVRERCCGHRQPTNLLLTV